MHKATTFQTLANNLNTLAVLLKVVTLVEGNEVGGSFYLNDTDAIAADASAEEMELLLEATGLGDVNVTRYQNR